MKREMEKKRGKEGRNVEEGEDRFCGNSEGNASEFVRNFLRSMHGIENER